MEDHRCHHCDEFTAIITLLGDIMTAQQTIDAQTTKILADVASLNADVTAIQAELAAGASVNTDALVAAVTQLDTATAAVNALATPATGGGNVVTVTSPGDQTSSISAGAVSLQVVGSDSDPTQTLSYAATGLPAGLTISTSGLITGTPSLAGSFPVSVGATDSTGAIGTATFTWTVTA
jgi:hypothetical protein